MTKGIQRILRSLCLLHAFSYKQHFNKQRQTEIGKKLSKR